MLSICKVFIYLCADVIFYLGLLHSNLRMFIFILLENV